MDDDDTVRRALRRVIASLSFVPVEFASGEEFIAALAEGGFACAMIDLHMPGLNGTEVISRMHHLGYRVPAIIITGGDVPKMRERCLKAGASAYMIKPVEREAVNDEIQSLII